MINNNAFAESVEGADNDEKDGGVLQALPSDLSARLEGNATGVYYPMYSLAELPQVLVAKNEYPNVPFNVNINPANGPGTSPSLAWANVITQLRHAGVIITGYVPTGYGNNPVVDVESMISRYQQFYPHMMDGIMLDEVASSNFTYYKEISDYARSIGFSYIRANPGGSILQENVPLYNQIAIYEGASYPNPSILESRTYFPQYSKDTIGFGATIHSEPAYDPSWLFMATKYLKWVYITDQTEPNPYAAFPSYFDQYLTDLAYLQQSHHYLTVNAIDSNGNEIKGIRVWLETPSGIFIKEAFTPCIFSITTDTSYRVVLANYGNYTFVHWQDQTDNVDRHRIFLVTSDETLNGVYSGQANTTNESDLTVLSMDKFGHPIDQLNAWLETPSGIVIQKTFTPAIFSITQGKDYRIVLANHGHNTFDYWQDQANNTDRHRIISINNDTTLFGIYQSNN